MILTDIQSLRDEHPQVIVIGSGPAGLVLALELRRRGQEVVMVEAGVDGFDAARQAMCAAEIVDPRRHAPMHLAVRRALGGTSLLWGGRCVAFDDLDFRHRPDVRLSGWPMSHAEIRPWYDVVAPYLDIGNPAFSAPVTTARLPSECRLDLLERWSNSPNLRRLHADSLAKDRQLRIHLGAVLLGLDIDPTSGRVVDLTIGTISNERLTLRARAVVLACGGLETTRLLLAAQRTRPSLFGGTGGPLGRYYMGHISGKIADIVFANAEIDAASDFFIDQSGRYVRRRITLTEDAQNRYGLLNLSAYPDNPPLQDPAHGNAMLSLAYLGLAIPGVGSRLLSESLRKKLLPSGVQQVPAHLLNVLRDVPVAAALAAKFLYGRVFAQPRLPGFFLRNSARRYTLHFHAEQAPNPSSTVRLSDEHDAMGVPRLKVDLRFDEADAQSVVRSHEVIDRDLQRAGIGRLEYRVPEPERQQAVLAQASDGLHQLGTTRMSTDNREGVVDADCRAHGTPNLFVASSSVFPTSGQANPTLLLAALSARLAAHLDQTLPHLTVQ